MSKILKSDFVEVMVLPTKRQVNRIIDEFDRMTEDLYEDYAVFEYYKRLNEHDVYEYVLNVSRQDKKRFEKRIDFILDLIKRDGGF